MAIQNLRSATKPGTSFYQFETGRDPLEGMSPISRWMAMSFSYSDQVASVVSVQVPVGARVLRVALEVTAVFTGTTAVVVGDGSAANGWIATGVVTPTVDNSFALDYDAAYAVSGKHYPSGDTIDVTFTGIATAGTGILWIEVISFEEETW